MKTLDYLQLKEKPVAKVVAELQDLLANFQIYYANLRGFHWGITGKRFFVLHEKFEEYYNDAAEKIDEIAERILMLGSVPENRFSEYMKVSEIKETASMCNEDKVVKIILDMLKVLLDKERKVQAIAEEAGDNVTVAMFDDYMKGQQKSIWMLVALEKENCSK